MTFLHEAGESFVQILLYKLLDSKQLKRVFDILLSNTLPLLTPAPGMNHLNRLLLFSP